MNIDKVDKDLQEKFNNLKDMLNNLNRKLDSNGSAISQIGLSKNIENIIMVLKNLSLFFPYNREYYKSLIQDFKTWHEKKGVPNFENSLNNYNPKKNIHGKDIEICIFPMYTPNNSMVINFEAILFKYQNPKELMLYKNEFKNDGFISAYLLNSTDGFKSECVVLFPEMIAQGKNTINNFGIIFSNREAKRFSFYINECVKLLDINIENKKKLFLNTHEKVNQSFILWDFIHDTNHFIGYLPFDKFMMKRKAPYWMYGVEELRVDLDTFVKLNDTSINSTISENVKFTLLFDRLFRFPIFGSEKKNYDGLSGQIIFGYLYKNDIINWENLKLTICWKGLDMNIYNLLKEINILYKNGVNEPKEIFWINTYKFIRQYSHPNLASSLNYKIDTNENIKDIFLEILDNEFPLNQFYKYLSNNINKNWDKN